MKIKRVYRQSERTSREQARLRKDRERFQSERPSLSDLLASRQYNAPIPQGAHVALRRLMRALRAERERQGQSLANIAARSGLEKAALSRLETGRQINPTWNTLWRYALALDFGFTIEMTPISREPRTALNSVKNGVRGAKHAKRDGEGRRNVP
jgi:transcriptional regulator with XRE-family HTH domain